MYFSNIEFLAGFYSPLVLSSTVSQSTALLYQDVQEDAEFAARVILIPRNALGISLELVVQSTLSSTCPTERKAVITAIQRASSCSFSVTVRIISSAVWTI